MLPIETRKKLKYLAAFPRIQERHDAVLQMLAAPTPLSAEQRGEAELLLDELVEASVLMGRTYGEDGLSPTETRERLIRMCKAFAAEGFHNYTAPDEVRADLPAAE